MPASGEKSACVVIPARFGSTRFPAKIIARETGKPLVQHVVERARMCRNISDIIVATDDGRVTEALRQYDVRCVMTSDNHPSGTDRVAEVARSLPHQVIINLQGDEPEIEPETIDRLAELTLSGKYDLWTAATLLKPPAQAENPNIVKVVFSREKRAMYFSRWPIPFWRDKPAEGAPGAGEKNMTPSPPPYYHHVGIYAYRREALLRLASLQPTPCEQAEKLEQLRALENGISIGVELIERAAPGIDTPEQYAAFVERYRRIC